MDFMSPAMRSTKKDCFEIFPKFNVGKCKDLMIRGGDFYAVWDEGNKVWATDQDTVIKLIDGELSEYAKNVDDGTGRVVVKYLRDSESGSIDKWRHYVQKQMEDNWVPLDGKLIFSNTEVKREDYSSHRLSYPLAEGDYSAFDELMSVLYSPEERLKIEWAIGAVVSGDSVKIQKFLVLTGDAGTGKSTVLKIIRSLFDGYTATIDAKAIGSPQASFALETLKKNPLVAMQDDADLSSIKDNTRLNSLISHEFLSVNEKFKSPYEHSYRCFIFLGSNEDVQITDSRSGIQRRLIDVRPTGKTFDIEPYLNLMERISFELGAIAYHCLQVYKANKHRFDKYKPTASMRATNPFYNFIEEKYTEYEEGVKLVNAWTDYNRFCDDNGLTYRMNKLQFKRELMPYFQKFIPEGRIPVYGHVYNWYDKIRPEKFGIGDVIGDEKIGWLDFNSTESLLDELYSDQPAQYAKEDGSPKNYWSKVRTTLKDIDKSQLYWVKLPPNVIKIDFDLKGPDGKKSLEENIKAANAFKPTYAELSKSGQGIHLYYIWNGDCDPDEISGIFDENIEIKKSTGNQAHRRLITKCNNLPVATLNSGLPLKEKKPKIEEFVISESSIRSMIKRSLAKEVHADTTSSVDWIYEILERAYISNCSYDVSDMYDEIRRFAEHSTNQSKRCLDKVGKMKFKSADRKVLTKGGTPMINADMVEFENEVRNYIREKLTFGKKNAREAIDLIVDLLNRIYESGLSYDVEDMRQSIVIFAIDNSKTQIESDYCISRVSDMKFSSEDPSKRLDDSEEAPIIFFDCEVFPNLIVICWKYDGEDHKVNKMINPSPESIRNLVKARLIGFNNKDYDNHILYAIMAGYSTMEVYKISKAIISGEKTAKFREAKNLSYTDIFDFSSKKQSLKDWEIEMGIHHQELGLPWDEPVDPKMWDTVADYCTNDVIATEALFHHLKQDWMARQILADLANSDVNESTNNLTLRIVFGNDRKPTLVYTNLATGEQESGR